MAVYKNLTLNSPLTAVEFTPVSDGNFSFFYIDSPLKTEGVKKWLVSLGQEIVGEAQTDGHPVLVTHGDKTKNELMKLLKEKGDKLELYHRKIPFSEKAWQTGATLAFIGQLGQLTSGFLRPTRKIDWSLVGLAVPNLVATTWILLYGAQRSDDTNRLTYLKEQFNNRLDDHVPSGEKLPAINEKRAILHAEPEDEPSLKDKADGLLKRYSVIGGEILLRYAGAFSLAFSASNWDKTWETLKTQGVKAAYFSGRTTVEGEANHFTGKNLTHWAGLLSLAGKSVALTSKAPDPYNPKPHTWIDTLREKVAFRLGGVMETAAFGAVAIDGFANKKIRLPYSSKVMPDLLSGIGGTLFTIRYAMRWWAPFGIKDTNMDELYAHVTDSLAAMPAEQLPKLMAESAASITDNFKDKHLVYGQVYTRLMTDLYRYHHIALDNLGTEPHERAVDLKKHVQAIDPKPDEAPTWKRTLVKPSRRKLIERAPAVNHAEATKAAGDETPYIIGA